MTFVTLGIDHYVDPTLGQPVDLGYIYIGEPGADPTVLTNRKNVTFRQENGSEIPAPQPIRTAGGGVPVYNGSPVQMVVDGDYSIAVHDSDNVQLYYVATSLSVSTLGSTVVFREEQTAVAGQTLFTLTTFNYIPDTNALSAYINGVRAFPTTYTETSATEVTFSEAVEVGSKVLFIVNEQVIQNRPLIATDAELNDVTSLFNIANKIAGSSIFNSDQSRPVYAAGNLAADLWLFSDGTTANTPV